MTSTELRPRVAGLGTDFLEPTSPRPPPSSAVENTGPTSWFDTFRRANNHSPESTHTTEHGVYNERRAARHTANTALVRKLKARHLQMIAIGGSIGAS